MIVAQLVQKLSPLMASEDYCRDHTCPPLDPKQIKSRLHPVTL